jgi:DNA-binding transcriptional MerR regulator
MNERLFRFRRRLGFALHQIDQQFSQSSSGSTDDELISEMEQEMARLESIIATAKEYRSTVQEYY